MSNVISISVLVASIVTMLGWFVTYLMTIRLQRRKDQLDLVAKRLSNLYGPLHMYCQTGKLLYGQLLNSLDRPQGIFSDSTHPPTRKEEKEWFHWMTHILGPLNDQRQKVILENSDLIVGDAIPDCIRKFMSHVAAYRAIMAKWKADNYDEHSPLHMDFPEELMWYSEACFKALKEQHQKLLCGPFTSLLVPDDSELLVVIKNYMEKAKNRP